MVSRQGTLINCDLGCAGVAGMAEVVAELVAGIVAGIIGGRVSLAGRLQGHQAGFLDIHHELFHVFQ